MRIFLGLTNIASMYIDLKEAFEEIGIETFVVSKYHTRNQIINQYCDFDIAKAKGIFKTFRPRRIGIRVKAWWDRKVDKYILRKAINTCDVFIFFYHTFRNDNSDLAEIRSAGKTIITVFVGDDIRWYYGMKQEFESFKMRPIEYGLDYDYSLKSLEERLRYLRSAEKHADFIFSRLDQSQLQLRPYYRWNMMVPLKKFIENPSQRQFNPIVAHAPSHRNIKGTKYVLEVFEKLKSDGIAFVPRLIENVSNTDAIEMYASSDILIDQLLCPGTGKLATEALASGTIVMGHMAYNNYPQKNPGECPIIDVNPDTLYDKLKELILNFEFRSEHALKGRPYVEKYLDVGIFCAKVLELRQHKVEFDYIPTFFREEFIPESQESIAVYNRWNGFVKACAWYKELVVPGERAGLKF